MELPVIDFIREILAEANPVFETRPGTAFYDMFITPQQLMLQPLNNTMDQILVSQSVRRILQQPDPDAYSETDVDDNVANVYIERDAGAFATGTVRVYYPEPLDKEFTAFTAEFSGNSLSFFNSVDISITAATMALQSEGSLYYMDVLVRAQNEGDAYILDPDTITAFINDTDAVRVTNIAATQGGRARETNTQLLTRAENSIGVRDLETIKGIYATLTTNYTFISSLYSIGMGDPEMQRDIIFNTHVGGKTDVYIKTPSLTTAFQDFVGMDYDTTRQLDRQIHLQMSKSFSDLDLPSLLGTPQIVPGSVRVREDIVETSARLTSVVILPSIGIDLSVDQWIRLQIDSGPVKLIKVAGAVPASTQRFEIINTINSAIGLTVAKVAPGNRFEIVSPSVGSISTINLTAVGVPYTEAADDLFGVTPPYSVTGIAAEEYLEDIDYEVDYVNGAITQKPYPRPLATITSGQLMITAVGTGVVTQVGASLFFTTSMLNQFLNPAAGIKVRVGDAVTISGIGLGNTGGTLGTLPQTLLVTAIDDINAAYPKLTLNGLTSTGPFDITDINFQVKSNQTVVVDYKFNPISIDIGAQVLLADGFARGVRPGRGAFTIKDTPFIDILSIEEIDPQSGEVIGEPLAAPMGYGAGGYGAGGYGSGVGGDYEYRILAPRERFSVFDDAIIILTELALTLSYRVTYRWVPEIVAIHNLSRNDSERVTGADVLPRNYCPCFVDIAIGIRRDATNLTTPTNEALAVLIGNYVNMRTGIFGVAASDISRILEEQGVETVRTPFDMIGTLLNTDGTTIILESQDILSFPEITLEKDTITYATKRIIHFYPGVITVSEV